MKPVDTPVASLNDAAALSPEQWAHVRALVEEMLDLPRAARTAFLDKSCGGDQDLRDRVTRLAVACERADGNWAFLAQPAGAFLAPLVVAALNPLVAKADLLARLTAALADRYRIDGELGTGGMATVYRADDVKHARQVAIKVFHPELSAMLGAERFLNEIRTTAALQHPHILPLFDSGDADGLLFFVMPLVEGETLRARLTRDKVLPVADAIRIASDVAGALDYAHRRGVIHRDVKPENILLHEGRPLVADFGIALAVQFAGPQRTTRPGLSLGTPQYMSPEQSAGELEITARSDVYALGAVTYEMLTGEPPFTGATVQQIIARVRAEEPRSITAQRKHVSRQLEAVVLTALEKLPADRFESAGEFGRALSEPGFRGRGPGTRATGARRGRRTLVVSLGALGLALAALAAWRSRTQAPPDVARFTVLLPRGVAFAPKSDVGASIAVSPDGRSVVFVGSEGDGTRRLYARTLDEARPHALVGTDGGSQPFFSPDGRWIAFWSEGRLQKLRVDGGLLQTVTDLPAPEGATWAGNDVIVYSSAKSLYSLPATGGASTRLIGPDSANGEAGYILPIALSDGDHLLYTIARRGGVDGTMIGLASLSARTGKSLGIRGLVALGVIDGRLIYATRDNTLMAVPFDVSAGRTNGAAVAVATDVMVTSFGSAKAALSRSGSLAYLTGGRGSRIILTNGSDSARTVLPETGTYSFPRFSPDGKRLAVSVGAETRSDVWVYDITSGTPTRISSGGSVNERPEWTPDGTRVVYRTDAGGTASAIWWRPADASAPATPLVTGAKGFWEGVITPDGKSIVVQADDDIAVRSLEGDAPMMTYIAESTNLETQPRVSPDGHWIAFVIDESGSEKVVVQRFPGPGKRVLISSSGGTEPVWSRDGSRLFYRANKKFMVAAVRSTTTEFEVVSRAVLLDDRFVTAAAPHASYDVSPDGKRLLVLEPVEDSQILMVHNWAAEVGARLRKQSSPR